MNTDRYEPLDIQTRIMDKEEGATIENMRQTHLQPFPEPLIQVPDDIDRNIMITSVDALLNWGRKSALWPVAFGLACCAFEMMATAMSRFDIARFGMEAFRATPRHHLRRHHRRCHQDLLLRSVQGRQ